MARGDPYVNTERVTEELTNHISNVLNEIAVRLTKTTII
jgi:hypothetical protein